MLGRRSHVRFAVIRSPEGVLRVMSAVLVQRTGDGEVIALSAEPGVVGEAVTVELQWEESSAGLDARIIGSHPVVVNGSVRHRLQLREIHAVAPRDDATYGTYPRHRGRARP